MITYTLLSQHSTAFRSLTGMNVTDFDRLYAEFAPVHQERLQATLTKRHQKPRRKAFGSGRLHHHSLQDRLLMTLIWLRIYTTYEVLGFFFSLNKTNIEDNLHEILATLDTLSHVCAKRPGPDQRKLRSPQAVMEAFPDVALIIDAKEQRIERPKSNKDNDQQKPYYSGKKKTHTLKNQVAVLPDGAIEAISESVPGANHDITLLRDSQLLDQLDAKEGAMMDKGYDGITNDYPDNRLYLPFKARRNHPLTDEQKAYNRILSKYRIVVEHTNAQLNRFAVLAQVWRNERSAHSRVVRVVAGLVNRAIHACPLKTYRAATIAA
jgi:hypothetical protein